MNELQQLLATVKAELRARGLTYRNVGVALKLSEASVKQQFSTGNISLSRGHDNFLSGAFDEEDASAFFVNGMLTHGARRQFIAQSRKLCKQFALLPDDSLEVAIGERHGTVMLLAIRERESTDYVRLRRTQTTASIPTA